MPSAMEGAGRLQGGRGIRRRRDQEGWRRRGGPKAEGRGGRGRESRPEGRGGTLAAVAFSSARLGNGDSFGIGGGRDMRRGARPAAAWGLTRPPVGPIWFGGWPLLPACVPAIGAIFLNTWRGPRCFIHYQVSILQRDPNKNQKLQRDPWNMQKEPYSKIWNYNWV